MYAQTSTVDSSYIWALSNIDVCCGTVTEGSVINSTLNTERKNGASSTTKVCYDGI